MSDLIYRQAAIECLEHLSACDEPFVEIGTGDETFIGKYEAITEISDLPSAPQRTGRWIAVDSYTAYGGDEATWMAHGNPIAYHYCSECKNQAYALEDGEELLSDYCPDCGAKMLKEGEG